MNFSKIREVTNKIWELKHKDLNNHCGNPMCNTCEDRFNKGKENIEKQDISTEEKNIENFKLENQINNEFLILKRSNELTISSRFVMLIDYFALSYGRMNPTI